MSRAALPQISFADWELMRQGPVSCFSMKLL
jgi:hypothetical protein